MLWSGQSTTMRSRLSPSRPDSAGDAALGSAAPCCYGEGDPRPCAVASVHCSMRQLPYAGQAGREVIFVSEEHFSDTALQLHGSAAVGRAIHDPAQFLPSIAAWPQLLLPSASMRRRMIVLS